jgi:hypothetical protein
MLYLEINVNAVEKKEESIFSHVYVAPSVTLLPIVGFPMRLAMIKHKENNMDCYELHIE